MNLGIKDLFQKVKLEKWCFYWALGTILLIFIEIELAKRIQTLTQLITSDPESQSLLDLSISTFAIFSLSLILFRSIFVFTNLFLSEAIREKITQYLRNSWLLESFKGPIHRVEASELNQILNEAIPKASICMGSYLGLFFQSFSSVCYLGVCIYYSPKLSLIALFLFFITLCVVKLLASRSTQVGQERNKRMSLVNKLLVRAKRNHKLLRVLNVEEAECLSMQKASNEYFNLSIKGIRYYACANVIPQSLGYLIIISVMIIAIIYKKTDGLIVFVYAILKLSQSLSQAAALFSNTKALKAPFDQATTLPTLNKDDIPNLIPEEFNEKLNSLKIQMNYLLHPAKTHNLLENYNIELKSGERLAIVGPSGCGKSTFLDAILGMYTNFEGSITLNSTQLPLSAMTKKIGYVGPDPYIIKGTLKENILFGHPNPPKVDSQQFKPLFQNLNLTDLIKSEHDLEKIQLSEMGDGLSTGQKQRISIARALLRYPDVLILDEATGNLDSKTEEEIWSYLKSFMKNGLIIYITHRRSLISEDDLVLDFSKLELNRKN